MQTKFLKLTALLLLAGLCSTGAMAQSKSKTVTKDETVIIKKDGGGGKTVIEIKDGSVYVNGEAVVTIHDADAAGVRKRIIIEDGNASEGDHPHVRAYGFDGDGGASGGNSFRDDEDFKDMPAPHPSRRAMLGVMTDPKSERVGALVKGITPSSPAEEAGLREGDLITRVDGKTIKDAAMLVSEIGAQHEPGDRVTINYERNGKEGTTTAKLDRAQPQMSARSFHFSPDDMGGPDMPNSFFRSFPFSAMDDAAPAPKLGVSAEDRADGDGVRVLSVKPGSPAATAGIKEGDVITRAGDDRIGSVDELQMAVRNHKGRDKLTLEYSRAGQTATVNILLPKSVKRKDL